MKKVLDIITVCIAGFALFSCSPKQDNYFDQSASERSSQNIEMVKKLLTSAPNGWRMEYYGDATYGGYNVMVKFDGTNATIGSEKIADAHKAGIGSDGKVITTTSHYTVNQSQGTIVSFDEYNETFHFFSQPNNPTYGTKDEGFGGDFEFRVMSASSEMIELRGKKHEAKVLMYPIDENTSWESIIENAENTEKFMSSRSYILEGEGVGEGITATTSYRTLIFTYTDANGNKQTVVAPYIVTEDGYTFYREIDIEGTKLNGLLKGTTDEYFVFANNESLKLETYLATLAESLQTGMWFISYSRVGDFCRPAWDNFKEKLKTATKQKTEATLYYAFMGMYTNKLGLHMAAGADEIYEGIKVEPLNDEGDLVRISWSTDQNSAGKTYYQKHGLKAVIEGFYGTNERGKVPGRTYKLTCDYQRKPAYITLTDVDEPTNVITLLSDQVNYPFDN